MDLVGGRYRIVRPCGAGGMGTVYEAIDEQQKRTVALKVISTNDADFAKRMRDEGKAAAKINHPNLVEVLDFGEDSINGTFLVFEYLKGSTLTTLLKEKAPMSLAEVINKFGRSLCDALEALHNAGVVHRDVKPDNLLSNEKGSFKLSDLGLALFSGREAKTATGGVVGTPGYLAPEAFSQSSKDPGPTFDIYSVAVIVVEAMTGKRAFSGKTPLEVVNEQLRREITTQELVDRGIKRSVAKVLSRALSKESSKRPQKASELLRQLVAAESETAEKLKRTAIVKVTEGERFKKSSIGYLPTFLLVMFALVAVGYVALSKDIIKPAVRSSKSLHIEELEKIKTRAVRILNESTGLQSNELISFFDDYKLFVERHKELGGMTILRSAKDVSKIFDSKAFGIAVNALTDVILGRKRNAEKNLRRTLELLRAKEARQLITREANYLELELYFCRLLKEIQLEQMKNGEIEVLERANDDVSAALLLSVRIPLDIEPKSKNLARNYRLFAYDWLNSVDRLTKRRQLGDFSKIPRKDLAHSLASFSEFNTSNLLANPKKAPELAQKYKKALWRICVQSDLLDNADPLRMNIGKQFVNCLLVLTESEFTATLVANNWGELCNKEFICTLIFVQLRELVREALTSGSTINSSAAIRAVTLVFEMFRYHEGMVPSQYAEVVRVMLARIPKNTCLHHVLKGASADIAREYSPAMSEYGIALDIALAKPIEVKSGLIKHGFFAPARIAVRRWELLQKSNKIHLAQDEIERFKKELPNWRRLGVRLFVYDQEKLRKFLKTGITFK